MESDRISTICESDKYMNRYDCYECKVSGVVTRVYYRWTAAGPESYFLCYNCSFDYIPRGFKLLMTDIRLGEGEKPDTKSEKRQAT
jgi:hypothetical protein